MFPSKASTYAILAVIEIARRQRDRKTGVQAGEIARQFGLPAAYAAKVMTQLARAEILRSDRGPRGGFRLQRPAEEIKLLEVVEAVDGVVGNNGWAAEEMRSRESLKGVYRVFQRVALEARRLLQQESIANFIEDTSGGNNESLATSGAQSHSSRL